MSYTPNEWQTGDVITAAKLNNMETGIENASNASMVKVTATATLSDNVYTVVVTGATPQEVCDAWDNDTPVCASVETDGQVLILNPIMIVNDQETGIYLYFSSSLDDVEETKLIHTAFRLTYSSISEEWTFEVNHGEMNIGS